MLILLRLSNGNQPLDLAESWKPWPNASLTPPIKGCSCLFILESKFKEILLNIPQLPGR